MSTFFKFLVAALVWLLFYLTTFRGCQEELCLACDPPPPITVVDTLQEDAGLSAYFKWSDPEAYIGKGVEAFLQKQVTEGDSLKLLKITGLYFESEKAVADAENLGLARAREVARLFDGLLDSTRLQLRARQVEAPEEAQSAPFEGALFEWVNPKAQRTVDQLADRISIIEGIGPKIEGLLNVGGIYTWKELANTTVERLQEILDQAGKRFGLARPDSWPRQAALAAAGEWEALQKLQDELQGGIDKS